MSNSGKKTGTNKPGKDAGIAHRVFDEVVKFKTMIITDIGKFKTDVIAAIKDIAEKHNGVAAQVAAQEQIIQNVAGFVSSKLGESNGNLDSRFVSIARSLRGTDLNILAMAEMIKEVVGQLTQVDVIINQFHARTKNLLSNHWAGLSEDGQAKYMTPEMIQEFVDALQLAESDIAEVKSNAETWYKDLLKSAFNTAQQKMQEQEREADVKYTAEQQAAKEAAEKLAAAQAERQAVADELQKAAVDESSLAAKTSGGQGSPFPEGAEIFGG